MGEKASSSRWIEIIQYIFRDGFECDYPCEEK